MAHYDALLAKMGMIYPLSLPCIPSPLQCDLKLLTLRNGIYFSTP